MTRSPRVIIFAGVIVTSIMLMVSCSPTYMAQVSGDFGRELKLIDHYRVERTRGVVLPPDVSLYVPMTHNSEGKNISRKITQSLADTLTPKFRHVMQGYQLESYDQALKSAHRHHADFFVFATVTKWHDRLNSKEDYRNHDDLAKIGLDELGLKILLIDTHAEYVVDVGYLYVKSGLFTLYDDRPDELLIKPLQQYAELISAQVQYQ